MDQKAFISKYAVALEDKKRAKEYIRVAAYFIWQKRIREGVPGSHLTDWKAGEKYIREAFRYLFFSPDDFEPLPCKRNEDTGAVTCPFCDNVLSDKANPAASIGYLRCPCCGEILKVDFGYDYDYMI